MAPPVTDTHRRATIRGRESVARWRIESGVWAGRIFAVMFGVTVLSPLLRRDGPDWLAVGVLLVVTLGVLLAAQRTHEGSRVAAGLLLALYVAAKLGAWLLGGQPLWHGAVINLIVLGALVNGLWGTLALAAVRRDAASVPPAPPRPAGRGAPRRAA